MNNPITNYIEKNKRQKQRQADRDRQRIEEQLKKNNEKNEKMLKDSWENAHTAFCTAMDEEDRFLARECANEMKFYEKRLKESAAQKRHAARLTRLAAAKANAVKTLQLMKESTRLLKLTLAGQISDAELDKLVDALEQDMEDIVHGAEKSADAISNLSVIPAEDEVTDEEWEALRKRHADSETVRRRGATVTEGDQEIADMLSSFSGATGNA